MDYKNGIITTPQKRKGGGGHGSERVGVVGGETTLDQTNPQSVMAIMFILSL